MLKFNFFWEKEILNRIRSNDRTVLGELFMRYKRLIFSYIQSHGGCEEDAEDMLQEAIIVLWQKVSAGTFTFTAKPGTYLLAVAKNKWMAEMRKRSRFTGNEEAGDVADGNSSVLDELLSEEKIGQVRRAMEALPAPCKKLLLLYYFEERNMDDISRILEFANANVAKSKKYQCMKALEAVLLKSTIKAERGK